MTITPHPPITRKDIAQMIGQKCNERTVGRNEKKWGLDAALVTLKTRMKRYNYTKAILILRDGGVID